MNKLLVLFILALSMAACSEQDKIEIEQSASAFDLNQAKASVQQSNLNVIKSFKKGDTTAIVTSYTKDAKLLPCGHPEIEGRDSIGKWYSNLIHSNVLAIELNTSNVWGDSILLAEEGRYVYKGDDSTVDKGKYIVLWKRQSGNWKMYREMRTSDYSRQRIIYYDAAKNPSEERSKKKNSAKKK